MLTRIKHFADRGYRSIVAITVFAFMLPLTLGMLLLMLLIGIATRASLRRHLHANKTDTDWQSSVHSSVPQQTMDKNQKPPIEGSYKVIDK